MPNLESPQLCYKKPSFPLDHVRGGPVLLDSPKQYLKRLSDGAKSQSDWHLMRWAVAIKVMRFGSDTFGDPFIQKITPGPSKLEKVVDPLTVQVLLQN